jgi:LemA protein
MILVIALLAVIVVVVLVVVGVFNGLVRARVKVDESWSDITVQLKRRADLIPNLVNAVKGYAAHESGVLEKVTEMRAQMVSAADQGPAAAAKADNMLTGALKSVFAVAENYPNLKADTSFTQLQSELADTEDKISASRRFYNSNVSALNSKVQVFPASILASMFGIKGREFFEVEDRAAIEQPVEVKF